MEYSVSLDLMEFIERSILPRYAAFDAAHNMEHVMHVIKSSGALARKMGADANMAYAIAAYPDRAPYTTSRAARYYVPTKGSRSGFRASR